MFWNSKKLTSRYRAVAFIAVISFATTSSAASLARVSGTILDQSNGKLLPGVQVFIEQGLTRPIRVTQSDANGYYEFPDVIPGTIGIFAYADGFSFGGFSILTSAGDDHKNQSIVLKKSSTISGQIIGSRRKPIADANIIRVLLVDGDLSNPGAKKFSIPFSKIRRFGFQVPTSDSKGNFSINRLPVDETAFIKVTHTKFAQQISSPTKVGASATKITLSQGVGILGSVLSRDNKKPVPNAPIIFRNILPPKDTTITRTGADGAYALRLRPGAYTYESVGSNFTSVTKPQVLVSGEFLTQQIDLIVAGKGTITGKVLDPIDEDPVVGASIVLETNGKAYKVTQTNASGEYSFAAPEGECSVKFWRAPGYTHSTPPGYSFSLMPGKTKTLLPLWLTPIPSYSLEVIDENRGPVIGAIVHVLHPKQIGWRGTDENGLVEISMAAPPENGIVIGYVDHPTDHIGALFVIDSTRADDAIVQLAPLHAVQGRAVDNKNNALVGQTISCEIGHSNLSAPVSIWKLVTGPNGNFQHPGVVEGTSLIYTATSPTNTDNQVASPTFFTTTGSTVAILPALTVPDGTPGTSLIGKSFPWRRFKKVKGSRSDHNQSRPKVVVFAEPARAKMMLKTLETSQQYLDKIGKQFVLIADAAATLTSSTIPLYQGTPPTSADVYVISNDNKVMLESIEIPTYSAIRDNLP